LSLQGYCRDRVVAFTSTLVLAQDSTSFWIESRGKCPSRWRRFRLEGAGPGREWSGEWVCAERAVWGRCHEVAEYPCWMWEEPTTTSSRTVGESQRRLAPVLCICEAWAVWCPRIARPKDRRADRSAHSIEQPV